MGISAAEKSGENVPAGVRVAGEDGRLVIHVRAGAPGWQPWIVAVLTGIWTASWGLGAAHAVKAIAAGELPASDPALFLCGAAALIGLYVTVLCLWTMFGREALVIHNHSLWAGTPWLFGFPLKRYDLREIGPFACSGKDCGAQADGCCCSWSTVDYHLGFQHQGKHVPLFVQLPREAKDWMRDKLEEARERVVRASDQ